MGERTEILMRIFVGIVSGIVLGVWKLFVFVITVINWIYTLFAGKRMQSLAELSETWNTQNYAYIRYIVLQSNVRPFPFTSLEKNITKFDSKKKK